MKFFCLRGSGEHCPVGVALAVRSLPRGIISNYIVVPHFAVMLDYEETLRTRKTLFPDSVRAATGSKLVSTSGKLVW